MRKIIFNIGLRLSVVVGLLFASTVVLAHDYPDEIGQCASVNHGKLGKAQRCVIATGFGTGASYMHLTFGKSEAYIGNPTDCPEYEAKGCAPTVGKSHEDASEGMYYHRDRQTGKIISGSDEGAWFCAKRKDNQLDVCYVYR